MSLRPLRPRRRLAVPFLVVLYPLCWLLVRDLGVTAVERPTTATLLRLLAATTAAVLVAYVVALAFDAALPRAQTASDGDPRFASVVVTPSPPVLVVLGVVTMGLGTYVVVSAVGAVPPWIETPASVLGVVVGLPVVLATVLVVGLGNAVPAVQSSAFPLAATLVGAALTPVWLAVAAETVTRLVTAGPPRR